MSSSFHNPTWCSANGPYELNEKNQLCYAHDPNRPWLSAVRKGWVVESIEWGNVCEELAYRIGKYLKNQKFPVPEYPVLSKKEKRRRRKQYLGQEWTHLFIELKEAYQQWEEPNQEVEEEVIPDLDENEEEVPTYTDSYLDLEEEYFREQVGPKSWWEKPYELMPRPHYQRRSKTPWSRMRFEERKTHEKFSFHDQKYYDDLEEEYWVWEREHPARCTWYDDWDDDDWYW